MLFVCKMCGNIANERPNSNGDLYPICSWCFEDLIEDDEQDDEYPELEDE